MAGEVWYGLFLPGAGSKGVSEESGDVNGDANCCYTDDDDDGDDDDGDDDDDGGGDDNDDDDDDYGDEKQKDRQRR